MDRMTTHERVKRMYEHRDADRIPVTDDPWDATIERWQREGMPQNPSKRSAFGRDMTYREYFGLDLMPMIFVDNSPRYPETVVEETNEYVITTTRWGATLKNWKHIASTPEFLDFTITGPDEWRQAKDRMTPSADRISWDYLKANYPGWRQQGAWINAGMWFGFDVTHSWMVGTERVLFALIEDPEWLIDIFNTCLDVDLALLDQVWDAGFEYDSIGWMDDMGYKHNQFFSVNTYRQILKPVHQRAIEWGHAKGVKVHLHSCGDINPFVPELVEIGLDALNPLEVKAGMDPIHLKQTFGDQLLLHGGINAVLWEDKEAIEAEMRRVIPVVKENGGYIFSSDHSVPSSVSLENFRYIVNLAKQLGSYD
jgi:uroporphyrinogen decarboxylase